MTAVDMITADDAGAIYRELFERANYDTMPPVLMTPDPGTGRIMLSPIVITGGDDQDDQPSASEVIGHALITLLGRFRTTRWVVVCTYGYGKHMGSAEAAPPAGDGGAAFRDGFADGDTSIGECLIALGVHCDGRTYTWVQPFTRSGQSITFATPIQSPQGSGPMHDAIVEIMQAHRDETLMHLH